MGAIATAAAVHAGLTAGRLALLAPMPSPLSQAEQLAAALGFGSGTQLRLIARIERRVGAAMNEFDMPAFGRAAVPPPTLLVHDRDDWFAPFDQTEAVAAAWPGALLHVTTGLGSPPAAQRRRRRGSGHRLRHPRRNRRGCLTGIAGVVTARGRRTATTGATRGHAIRGASAGVGGFRVGQAGHDDEGRQRGDASGGVLVFRRCFGVTGPR